MKIYLLRHGQTSWNVEGRIQGKQDVELNETGIRQAIEAYFYGIDKNGELPPENLKNCEIREYEL